MQITVLAFGIAKDIFGGSSVQIDLPEIADAAQLKHVLESRYPKLGNLASYMLAVNSVYADDSQIITASDEVAIIPPVSGG